MNVEDGLPPYECHQVRLFFCIILSDHLDLTQTHLKVAQVSFHQTKDSNQSSELGTHHHRSDPTNQKRDSGQQTRN